MMFGKSSNTKQEVNVNTNFFNSYSDTAHLSVSGWNAQLSIKIKPCVGHDASGVRQYAEDRGQMIITSITADNAQCLIQGFEDNVMPAIKHERESGTTSIVMGDVEHRKVLTIGYENNSAYLSIACDLDENGKAGVEIKHTFNKRTYLSDYNPNEGGKTEVTVETELLSFMDIVRSVKDLRPIIAHSIKYNDATRTSYTPNMNSNNTQASNNTTSSNYQAETITSEDDDISFVLPF